MGEGYGDEIIVTVDTKLNKYTVADKGRGIPHGMKKLENGEEKEILEVICTKSNSSGKFNTNNYTRSAGINGLGITITSALSKEFKISSVRDGEDITFESEHGNKVDLIYTKIDKLLHGTTTSFIPDSEMFKSDKIPLSKIEDRARVASALGYRVKLFVDEKEIDTDATIFDLITENDESISIYKDIPPIVVKTDNNEEMRVALRYTSDTTDRYFGYTNMLTNSLGGTHLNEISKTIIEAWEQFIDKKRIKLEVDLRKSDYLVGLRTVCAVFISQPEFSSQTKEKLVTHKSRFTELMSKFKEEFSKVLYEDEALSKALIKRFTEYRIAQNKLLARKDIASVIKVNEDSSDNIRRRSIVSKLRDCLSKKKEGSEMFIVEGNSAMSPFLLTRDKQTQAVLPLRGKILNITNREVKDALKNAEICDIANAIGAGIGSMCDPSKSRYERLIISCFTGDTKVKCLDGNSYSFEELVKNNIKELWVYSRDKNNKIIPALARNPRIVDFSNNIYEIILDNKEKIKCTGDQLFMLADGTYKRADELKDSDSLSPLYIRTNEKGYLQVYQNISNEYINVHTLVNNEINYSNYENLDFTKYYGKFKIPVTHHKDYNKLNNCPENLEWMLFGDHLKHHNEHFEETLGKWIRSEEGRKSSAKIITEYNKSEKHKIRMRELSKQGALKTWKDTYNGSEKHINAVKESWKDEEKAKRMKQSLIDWNIKNAKKKITELNKDPEMIKYQQQCKLGKFGKLILDSGFELSEELLINNRNELKHKFKNIPTINSVNKYFNNFNEFIEFSQNYNHKIKSIKKLDIDESVPVYCLTVDDYHNFALDSGVFVRNCDSDPDGAQITCLVLSVFVNLFPDLVKEGLVYFTLPPLYTWYDNSLKRFVGCMKPEDIPNGVKAHRIKGLGELDDKEMHDFLINPATRNLIQVEYPTDVDKFNRILGSAVGKNELMRELGIVQEAKEDI